MRANSSAPLELTIISLVLRTARLQRRFDERSAAITAAKAYSIV